MSRRSETAVERIVGEQEVSSLIGFEAKKKKDEVAGEDMREEKEKKQEWRKEKAREDENVVAEERMEGIFTLSVLLIELIEPFLPFQVTSSCPAFVMPPPSASPITPRPRFRWRR